MATNTNVQILNQGWSFSAAGACGISALLASIALSSPGDNYPNDGRHVVMVEHLTANASLHIEPRSVFTNITGSVVECKQAVYFTSNTQAWGGSAATPGTFFVINSGENIMFTLSGFAGRAIRIYGGVAGSIASATANSGNISIWRV